MKAKKTKPVKPEENLTTEQKVRREAIAWFWVILILLLVNGTVGQARVIPSASMQNTLLIGDHLFMSRFGYDAGVPFTDIHKSLWRTPKRQQIVIFRPVVPGDTSDVIKRVIGLPGGWTSTMAAFTSTAAASKSHTRLAPPSGAIRISSAATFPASQIFFLTPFRLIVFS